nr:MAG TPA: hypothetical protein [Caudoviricetes sp.]
MTRNLLDATENSKTPWLARVSLLWQTFSYYDASSQPYSN